MANCEGQHWFYFFWKGNTLVYCCHTVNLTLIVFSFLLSPRFRLSKQRQGDVWPSFPRDLAKDRQVANHLLCSFSWRKKKKYKSVWPSSLLKQRKHYTWFSLPLDFSSVLFHKCFFSTQESVKEKKLWPDHTLTSQLVWRIHSVIQHCSHAPLHHPHFWMLSSVSSCMLCKSPDLTLKFKLRKRTPLQLFWTKQFPWLHGHLLFPMSFTSSKAPTSCSLHSALWIILHQEKHNISSQIRPLSPTSTRQAMVLSPWTIIREGKWRNCSQLSWTTMMD